MALEIENVQGVGNNPDGFFRPKEWVERAYVILFEPKSTMSAAEVKIKSPKSLYAKDTVVADVTVWETEASLASGEPTAVFPNSWIDSGGVTSRLKDKIGKGLVGVLESVPNKKKPGEFFPGLQPAPSAATGGVVAYVTARDTGTGSGFDTNDEPPPF